MTPPLAVFTMGDGPLSTVLLHGFLGSGKNLRTLATRWLARDPNRRFLLPDLRGHGDSPPLNPTTDLDALGADVVAAARAAGFSAPLHLVGHSLGGRVALAAARLNPLEVTRVTLLDIAPGPVGRAAGETQQVLEVLLLAPARAADRREMKAFLTDHGLSSGLSDWLLMNFVAMNDGYAWQIDRQALSALQGRFIAADLWDVIRDGHTSVACIRGGLSPYVTDDDVARLQAAGCAVHTVDAGHYVHVEALDRLLDLLMSI